MGQGEGAVDDGPGAAGVDAGGALEDGFGDDGDGVVAGHAVGVAAPQGPDGEVALGLALHDEALHEGGHELGGGKEVEGMGGTEGVPAGEGGIEGMAPGAVEGVGGPGAELPIGVGKEVGLEEEVVEGGVEEGALLGSTLEGEAAEEAAPLVLGLADGGGEVPGGKLFFHILHGSLLGHGGEGDFHFQGAFAKGGEAEEEAGGAVAGEGGEGVGLQEGAVRAEAEVDVAADPDGGLEVAGEGVGVDPAQAALAHAALLLPFAPGGAVLEVEEEVGRGGGGEGVAVVGHAGGGGEFGEYAAVDKAHAVVAGTGGLGGFVHQAAHGSGDGDGREGKEEEVAEVHAAGAGEVGLGEAEEVAVGVEVFSAVLPADAAGDGTGLNERKGTGRTGVGVAVGRTADEGVDGFEGVGFEGADGARKETEEQQEEQAFHGGGG